jgi:flagellar protein FliS
MTTAGGSLYREMEILSLSPAQRVVLLYAHLLANLRHARRVFASDIETRAEKLQRARDIVFELCASLDRERGDEIARNLTSLYAYAIEQLGALEFRRDSAQLDELIAIFATLHDAWQQAAVLTETEGA